MNGNIVDIYFDDKNLYNIVYQLDLRKSNLFRIKTPDIKAFYEWIKNKKTYVGMMLEGVHYIRLYYGEDSVLLECVIGDLSFDDFIKMMNDGKKAVGECVYTVFKGCKVPAPLAVLMIYSYIIANVKYDSASYDNSASYNEKYHIESWTAYGALRKLKAVCEGYSWAMINMLLNYGIVAQPVFGYRTKGGSLHQWLKVRIDDEWYNVEPTFSASYSSIPLDGLLLSDETMTEKGYSFYESTNFWPAKSKRFEGEGQDKLIKEYYDTICNYGIHSGWLTVKFIK